jgi:hypothetical protein
LKEIIEAAAKTILPEDYDQNIIEVFQQGLYYKKILSGHLQSYQ